MKCPRFIGRERKVWRAKEDVSDAADSGISEGLDDARADGRQRLRKLCSVRHRVEDDVDAERVGFFLRELAEEILELALALPAVAVVGVVADDDAEPAFVVVDAADVALLGV